MCDDEDTNTVWVAGYSFVPVWVQNLFYDFVRCFLIYGEI
jgi:hypothetical protein